MTSISPLLEVSNLSKSYPSGFNLGPVSLSLNNSSTVAFLGANGAGKSTLFQIMTGNLDSSEGTVLLNKKRLTPDSHDLKRKVGYLPQNLQLPRWLSGLEVLRYGARLYSLENGDERIDQSLRLWDCASYSSRPLAACSHGMQKRVGLALANLHNPDLLILDEPFSGLDVYHMKTLEEVIKKRQVEEKCTIISTHIAPFVASLCQRVFISRIGKITEILDWSSVDYLGKISLIEAQFFAQKNKEKST